MLSVQLILSIRTDSLLIRQLPTPALGVRLLLRSTN